jgi:hypothetical protein
VFLADVKKADEKVNFLVWLKDDIKKQTRKFFVKVKLAFLADVKKDLAFYDLYCNKS